LYEACITTAISTPAQIARIAYPKRRQGKRAVRPADRC
jgi:hypothetical protein